MIKIATWVSELFCKNFISPTYFFPYWYGSRSILGKFKYKIADRFFAKCNLGKWFNHTCAFTICIYLTEKIKQEEKDGYEKGKIISFYI